LSKFRKGSILVALIAVCSLVAAVSAFGSSSATTTVAVTAGKPSEFNFTLAKKAAPKGTVVFKVTNKGAISHDFKIAGKQTPNLAAGKAGTLKIVFKKAGKYPFLCTLPGHAAGGMKGTFIVK
jgi:uncharacterized cupredoxin-like copper-binding protein